ncbi:MAG TPA: hypothetical protein VK183_01420, partial [Flavobacterium sp.]|nr:hypothetical protein [Flavobacterium sp.]
MKKLLSTFLLFPLTFCLAQDLAKDSIQVNKYLKEVVKPKVVSKVYTITDPKKVQFISAYIDAKNNLLKAEQDKQENLRKNLLGRRFINGDTTVKGQVLAILQEKDSARVTNLLDEMDFDYRNPTPERVLDTEVTNALFALIEDERLEPTVIQFLGFNGIAGRNPIFLKRLLSGQSKDEDRLVYWLSNKEGYSQVLDYVDAAYRKNPLYFEEMSWAGNALALSMEKASEADRQKILSIAYDYMNRFSPQVDPEIPGGADFETFYGIAVAYGTK